MNILGIPSFLTCSDLPVFKKVSAMGQHPYGATEPSWRSSYFCFTDVVYLLHLLQQTGKQ